MTTTTTPSVARTILEQIGPRALMMLGAHKICAYRDAVTFNIKIAKPGQTRARIMLVKIDLTPMDLYNVNIGLLERNLDWYNLVDHKGIDAEQMVDVMGRLALRA